MSDAYAPTHIPKSLSIHGVALTSTGRKIEHRKVVVDTQTSKGNGSIITEKSGFSCLSCVIIFPPEATKMPVVGVEVQPMDLQSCWECPWTCYTHIQSLDDQKLAEIWQEMGIWWAMG